jgi:UDP-3-O-[3-hydroxymyristoyl] glucosamine N-acyltransferase
LHTTGSIAEALGAELIGRADIEVKRLDTLGRAGPGEMTFIRDDVNGRLWASTQASAALISRGVQAEGHDPSAKALLLVSNADLALIRALEIFAPPPPTWPPGIHPSAVVDLTARVDPSAHVGPLCVVEAGVTIGPGTVLVANVHLGAGASIGAKTTLYPGVSVLDCCVVGNACVLHAGVVIGADGFGFRPDAKTGMPVKIPHIGNAVLGHGVEVGANSAIDRAKFGSTVIGDGTKIDNLVQIAHNCQIGRCCLLCGQVGLGGSVTLGDGVVIGGAASVRDNVNIGARAQIAGRAGVTADVEPGSDRFGLPALPGREAMQIHSASRRLREMFARLRALERRVLGDDKKPDA